MNVYYKMVYYPRRLEESLDVLELELWMVAKNHVGAGY